MKKMKKFSLYGYKTKEEVENIIAILKTYNYVVWRECSTNIYGIDRKPGTHEYLCDVVRIEQITINTIESVYDKIEGVKPTIESVQEKLMNFISVREDCKYTNSNTKLATLFQSA